MQQIVWVLESGEAHRGGHVIGVFAEPELAQVPLAEAVADLGGGVLQTDQDGDGKIKISTEWDWVTLTPHTVQTLPPSATASVRAA